MRELGLHLAQRRLGLVGADRCGDVVAGAPVTEKSAFCVKAWLAADLDIHQRSVEAHSREDEITERLMRIEHRPMKLPFFRLRFDVLREIPSGQPNPARQRQASQRTK